MAVRDQRPLGEVLTDLTHNMTLLVRQEMDLARAEMSRKAAEAGRDAAALAVGGVVAYVGGLAILFGVILALADLLGIDVWISALVVGAVVALIGGIILWRALNDLKTMDLAPRRTVRTLKGDVQWAREITK